MSQNRKSPTQETQERRRHVRNRNITIVIVCVVILVTGALLWNQYYAKPKNESSNPGTELADNNATPGSVIGWLRKNWQTALVVGVLAMFAVALGKKMLGEDEKARLVREIRQTAEEFRNSYYETEEDIKKANGKSDKFQFYWDTRGDDKPDVDASEKETKEAKKLLFSGLKKAMKQMKKNEIVPRNIDSRIEKAIVSTTYVALERRRANIETYWIRTRNHAKSPTVRRLIDMDFQYRNPWLIFNIPDAERGNASGLAMERRSAMDMPSVDINWKISA